MGIYNFGFRILVTMGGEKRTCIENFSAPQEVRASSPARPTHYGPTSKWKAAGGEFGLGELQWGVWDRVIELGRVVLPEKAQVSATCEQVFPGNVLVVC